MTLVLGLQPPYKRQYTEYVWCCLNLIETRSAESSVRLSAHAEVSASLQIPGGNSPSLGTHALWRIHHLDIPFDKIPNILLKLPIKYSLKSISTT
jgi:hypothetical protein